MANRYEDAITRAIMAMTFASGIPEVAAAYDFTDAIKALATALRDQDTWYAIDDPEHPAPREEYVLAMILDEDDEEIWLPQLVIYAKHNHVPIYGWLRHADKIDGEEMESVRVSRWRPLPAPPLSGRAG